MPGQPRPANDALPYRVVVVDDEKDAADALAELIRLLGHDPYVAYDGRSAVSMIHGCRPQVVLLDLVMPEFSGFDVYSAVRRAPELRDTRIIALTGLGRFDEVQSTIAFGFDGHVVKPPSIEIIRDALRQGAGGPGPIVSL